MLLKRRGVSEYLKRNSPDFPEKRIRFSYLTENENNLEVVGKEGNNFIVKVPDRETFVKIEDTYAEILPSLVTSPVNSTPIIFLK